MKEIAIVGVTLSGNMGGQAMLLATLEAMRKRSPGCRFHLLSIYPGPDKEVNSIDDLSIISAYPSLLIGLYLPLSLLVWLFIRMRSFRQLLSLSPYFRTLLKADMVIDLCGIAFVDGRGLPLLMYNVACCLPAIILGTPVVKLAQALGPFKRLINRIIAKFTLRRCAAVVTRGEQSANNISDLNIQNTLMLPDVTFALEVSDSAKRQAKTILVSYNINQSPLIISPSRVMQKVCSKEGINFIDEISDFLKKKANDGTPVVLLPHSYAENSGKNNDLIICQAIMDRLPQDLPVKLIGNIQDAIVLRALIGEAKLFIGCRFHSVVAALAMNVPCMVIGWSHKYIEMVKPFGLSDWVFDISSFSAENMLVRVQALQEKIPLIRKQIQTALPAVAQQAEMNFDIAMQVLDSRNIS